jgi:hypothetical protein
MSPEQKIGLIGLPIVMCHGVDGKLAKELTTPIILTRYF